MVALKTFHNLSEARQTEIIQVCLEEFALNDYQSASLSVILKNLKLAKGSFYRYFENKHSLYFFLLDYCVNKRIKSDYAYIQQPSSELHGLILQHFEARVYFDKIYPLESAFLYNVQHEKNSEELGNIKFLRLQKAMEIMERLVDQFVQNKQLRSDLSPQLIAWHILQTQLSISDFLELHFKLDFRENIKSKKPLYTIADEEVFKVASQFVEILKTGYQPK